MAGIQYAITADNSNFLRRLQECENGVRNTSRQMKRSGMSIEDMFTQLSRAAAGFGAAFSAQEFVQKVAQVRGEFQQLEVAFNTMLGSQDKASALMSQLVDTAAHTPFDLKGIADGAKQLLAYGMASDEVNDTLVRLGNIASGLSLNLNDLVWLYGTTMTQGRLYAQDYRQFVSRGIPLTEELAKQFGVTKDEVAGLVTEGKVGFPEVQKAIQSLTGEGGKFYNLMEEQSKTITGQISNLGDAVDMMFNEIGKSSEGAIGTVLSVAKTLIENWEQVGKIILVVAAAFGTYKAALLAVWAANRIAAIAKSVGAFISLARSITSAKDAMLLFNMATKANPIGLIISLIATAATAFLAFKGSVEEAAETSDKFGESLGKATGRVDTLFDVIDATSKGSKAQKDAISDLVGVYDEYGIKIDKEGDVLGQINDKRETLIALIKQEAIERQKANLIQSYDDARESELKSLSDALSGDDGLKGLDIANSKVIALAIAFKEMAASSADEMSKLSNKVSISSEEIAKQLGLTAFDLKQAGFADISGATGNWAYDKISERQVAQLKLIKEMADEAGVSFSDMYDAMGEKVIDTTNSIVELNTAQHEVVEESHKLSPSFDSAAYRASLAAKSVDELRKYIADIMRNYNDNNIRFSITVDESDIPDWMKGFSSGKSKNLAEYYMSEFRRMEAIGAEYLKIGGQVLSREDVGKRGLLYSEQASVAQESEKRQQKEADKTAAKQQKAAERARKQREREAEERKKTAEKLNEELRALEQRNIDDEIDLLQDGSKKRLREIENDYNKQRAAIDKQEKQWVAGNKKAGRTGLLDTGLTLEQTTALAKARTNAELEYQQGRQKIEQEDAERQRQAMDDYLKEYGTYQEKRLAITSDYNDRIQKAETEGERLSLGKERDNELKELDFSEFKTQISFADVFGDLGNLSSEALSKLKKQLSEYINKAASELKPEDLKELQDAFSKIEIEEIDRNPFKGLKTSLDSFRTSQDAVEKAQKELNIVMNGGEVVTGFYMDDNKQLHNTLLTVAQAEKNLSDAQSDRQKNLEKLGKTVNDIGAKGGQLVNSGQEIVGMLENFGVEVPDAVKGTLDGLGQMMSGLESMDITKPFSLITGAIKTIAGFGNMVASWFNGDNKREKRIQELQEQVDALDKSYEQLGKSIDNAYSKDASKLIEQQNRMLEQQRVLVQQQMAEEEAKKKTDDDRIKEYQERLNDINEQLEENKQKAEDAIFGEDLKTSIENFASAYADAWTSGEDRATSARDTVKKLMQSMVTESIKSALQSSKAMEAIRTKLKQFYTDNVLSGWEQDYIYKMADDLQKELDRQFGWADGLMQGDSEQQSASSRGFETMSQDTAEELNGRFTALQETGINVRDSIVSAVALLQSMSAVSVSGNAALGEIRNLMIYMSANVEDIAAYAKKIYTEFGTKIDAMNRNIQAI